jgi:predicted CoA-binding protein
MSTNPTMDDIRRVYAEAKTIAVVGASPDTSKRAHIVPAYLQEVGYRIIPVNPNRDEILGERAYPTLEDIPQPVDVVDVFRPFEEAPGIAASAAAIGAKVLWLQVGIMSEEAGQIATDAGMTFVSNLCMGAMHAILELGPGPAD